MIKYFTTEETSMDLECVSGEFGLTIRDCEVGFEITRANYDWVRTNDINQYNQQQELPEINDPNYLGGVLLGKKGQGTVSIHVANGTIFSSENAFEEFVDGFYLGQKAQYPDEMIKEPYPVGNTAIIEMEGNFDSNPQIVIIKIEEHNGKFYIFSKSYRTDIVDADLDAFRSEQEQVIDSFNYVN